MNIGLIHPGSPTAEGTGADHSATQIARGLYSKGHEVTVYCNNSKPDSDSDFATKNIEYNSSFPHDPVEKLNKAIINMKEDFASHDIVHSYLMRTIPSMTLLGSYDMNVIVTLNAYAGVCPKNDLRYMGESDCKKNGVIRCAKCNLHDGKKYLKNDSNSISNFARMIYNPIRSLRHLRYIHQGNRGLDSIDGFQALSTHVKDKYSDFDYPQKKIKVIPNILDDNFVINHNSDFSPPFRLLYVGYLREHKGVDRLIPILSKVNSKVDEEITLTIAGNGPYLSQLKHQVNEYDMNDIVNLKGHVPYQKLPMVYANHDLFIYPGRWDEPFGRVFLEALATGTPIAATNVGSVDEIIGSGGRTGHNSVEGLSEVIANMLFQNVLQRHSNNSKEVVEMFRPENIINKIEQLYLRCV